MKWQKKMAKHGKKILRNKSANSLLFSVLSIFGFMKEKSKSQDVCNYTEKEIWRNLKKYQAIKRTNWVSYWKK